MHRKTRYYLDVTNCDIQLNHQTRSSFAKSRSDVKSERKGLSYIKTGSRPIQWQSKLCHYKTDCFVTAFLAMT